MPVIIVNRLVKRFGSKNVLRQLNLEVDQGEFVALLGPNGAGKTTLLRILCSLSRPSMGHVEIAGCVLPDQSTAARRRLGIVSHQPLLYGELSANENLRFYARLYNLKNPGSHIRQILAMLGLEKRQDDLVRTFSRGMQQRLAIGRAILHDPEILLLDEPHTGLDQEACDRLDDILGQVARQGRTIVMTSHDLVRVNDLASRYDVLSGGVIQKSIRHSELPPGGLLTFYRQALGKDI